MKFQIFSDIHLEFYKKIQNFPVFPVTAEYLILAGDIGYPEQQIYKDFLAMVSERYKKIIIIAGNHEYYQGWKNKYKGEKNVNMDVIDETIHIETAKYPNIIYLNNEVTWIEGIKIIGSIGWYFSKELAEFGINDYLNIWLKDKYLRWGDVLRMHLDCVKFIENEVKEPCIVITHHLPSKKMIQDKFQGHPMNFAYYSDLDFLIKSPVKAWISGHSHGFIEKTINEIPCVVNAIGYKGEISEPNFGFILDI
jgi:predicted phosphodiesterase